MQIKSRQMCNMFLFVSTFSKGISRAGIFIALDNLFTQALTTGYINPQAIVKQMNNQLKNIIESKVWLLSYYLNEFHTGIKINEILSQLRRNP